MSTRKEDFYPGLWSAPWFERLSLHASMLYIWSFTNTRVGTAGLYEVGPRAMLESKVPEEHLQAALDELAAADAAFYEQDVLWVRARARLIRPRSVPMAISVARAVDRVAPEHPLRVRWLERYGDEAWLRDALRRELGPTSPDPHPTVGRTSGDVHEIPDSTGDSVNVTLPSPDALPSVINNGNSNGIASTKTENGTAARAKLGFTSQHQLPDRFPERLASVAEHVHQQLGAMHPRYCRDGSEPPALYRVGLALRDFPDVDHALAVGALETFLMGRPDLQRRGRVDLAAFYRHEVERASRRAGRHKPPTATATRTAPASARDLVAQLDARRSEDDE